MKKIMFICHGNICRSPMAEFVLKDMLNRAGVGNTVCVASSATSTEELGNPVHPGTRKKLTECGVTMYERRAILFKKTDYEMYDYLICMDSRNVRNLLRITGGDPDGKVCRLLDFCGEHGDIADPWYTGNFDETYADIVRGCRGLIKSLNKDSEPYR